MLQKWRTTLTNTTGAAQIINLIWTVLAANYFVGTRSWLTQADALRPNLQDTHQKRDIDTSRGNGQVPGRVYQCKIQYHYVHAIPAAISVIISAMTGSAGLISIFLNRGILSRLRHYIYSLSSGRLLGYALPQEWSPSS